jgi:hypothetical protein
LCSVESPFVTGEALHDYARIFVDKYAHIS